MSTPDGAGQGRVLSRSPSPRLSEGGALIAPVFQKSRVRFGSAEAGVTQMVRTRRMEFGAHAGALLSRIPLVRAGGRLLEVTRREQVAERQRQVEGQDGSAGWRKKSARLLLSLNVFQ